MYDLPIAKSLDCLSNSTLYPMILTPPLLSGGTTANTTVVGELSLDVTDFGASGTSINQNQKQI